MMAPKDKKRGPKDERTVPPEPDTEDRGVTEADVESFPASDAPASWAGRDSEAPAPPPPHTPRPPDQPSV